MFSIVAVLAPVAFGTVFWRLVENGLDSVHQIFSARLDLFVLNALSAKRVSVPLGVFVPAPTHFDFAFGASLNRADLFTNVRRDFLEIVHNMIVPTHRDRSQIEQQNDASITWEG